MWQFLKNKNEELMRGKAEMKSRCREHFDDTLSFRGSSEAELSFLGWREARGSKESEVKLLRNNVKNTKEKEKWEICFFR